MANTYTQIHIHAVFVVKSRQCLINPSWENDLFKYISGIVNNHGHKMLQINGMPDHVHILIGMRPNQSLSDLMKFVKQDSSKWINQNKLVSGKFSWQSGYGAFSHSKSQVPRVISYIKNQKNHHKSKSFMEEYLAILKTHKIEYDERYVFKPV